jgi:uncharacterized protein
MKIRMKAAAFLVATALAACAENPPAPPPDNGPAHEASVRELLELTQPQKMMEGIIAQTDAMMRESMQKALGDENLTLEQQVLLDEMRGKILDLMKDQLKWEAFEPKIIAIYEDSLSEQEVQGMLAFYRTDAGKAVIAKMPLVVHNTMQMMQQMMTALMPKMQQIEQEYIAKLKATKAGGAKNGAAKPQPN